ncbi:MAG TPA: hypothetical protein VGG22_06300 [Candidatus Baltobacteraceae bacterium]
MRNLREFARHGAIVFAGLTAGNLFLYLYYVIIGRVVGLTGYGVVTALMSAILLFSLPSTVAGAVIAKAAADFHATGEGARLRWLANLVDRAAWAAGAIVFALVAVFSASIGFFFHLTSTAPVIAAGAALGLSLVVTAQRAYLQGRHRFEAFALSYVIDALSRAILGGIGAHFYGVAGALGGVAIDLLITTLFDSVAMRHGIPQESVPLDLSFGGFAGSAVRIGLTLLAVNAMLSYDTILVRHYFSAETAGLYSAAALVARGVYAVVAFIPIVLLPSAAKRAAQGERSTHLLMFAGTIVCAVGVVAIAASIVAPGFVVRTIAGPAFADAGPYVLPYVTALVALAGANAVANYKIGLGRMEQAIPLTVIAFAQIVFVVMRHDSVHTVLMTLLTGDICALIVTLYGVMPVPAGLRPRPIETR